MSLFNELKRRNVLRVGAAYVVAAWLIIQVVETIFPVYGLSDAAIRLVISVLAIAFIPSLAFSWAFEITPEGLKREVDVVREHSITRFTGKKLDRVIMVLLALALSYFAFDKFVLDPARDAKLVEETAQQARSDALVESYGDKSIAVLPFVNMSDDAANEYFSDGISEELLNLLAKIPELRVISRSSSFSFKGKDIAIPSVAKQLNVAHVLEGSVRKVGNRVRITAQLIEARSDSHLWSESYDRELNDIFAVQDEIAAAISDALKVKLDIAAGEAARPTGVKTTNADAYDAYLRGLELIRLRGRQNLEDAIRHLERSLRLDERFAPAHAQLAIATTLLPSYKADCDRPWLRPCGASTPEEARRTAVPHLDRAQELEPDLAEAHGGRALLALVTNDPESTVENARKALASNPGYTDARLWLVQAFNALGRWVEMDASTEQLQVTDPLSIVGRAIYVPMLAATGRVEEAQELADQLVAQSPAVGYSVHAETSLFYEGKIVEGLSWALRAQAEDPSDYTATFRVRAFIWVGEYHEARRVDDELTGDRYGRKSHMVDIVEGRFDKAIQAAQRRMQLDPKRERVIAAVANVLYAAGRTDEALPLYERLRDFAPEGQLVGWGSYDIGPTPQEQTIRLALARRKAGDKDGAQAAAQIVRQAHAEMLATGATKYQFTYRTEAVIAAFENNPDAVIVALKSAMRYGLRDPQFFDDSIFKDVRDEPRFIALQQELDAILAKEHDKVLQLICFNNPTPDNWQPLPETCEGVDNLQN